MTERTEKFMLALLIMVFALCCAVIIASLTISVRGVAP
jgi:hypothetical protein